MSLHQQRKQADGVVAFLRSRFSVVSLVTGPEDIGSETQPKTRGLGKPWALPALVAASGALPSPQPA